MHNDSSLFGGFDGFVIFMSHSDAQTASRSDYNKGSATCTPIQLQLANPCTCAQGNKHSHVKRFWRPTFNSLKYELNKVLDCRQGCGQPIFRLETSVIFNNRMKSLRLRFRLRSLGLCSIASRIRMMAKLSASILHTKYLVYPSNHIASYYINVLESNFLNFFYLMCS